MNNKYLVGKIGEDTACIYLEKRGFKIIERNFRKPWGELDIVAKDSKGTLIFVEVKTMRQLGNAAIRPEDNLTKSKLSKLQRVVSLYVGFNKDLVSEKKGWRIDLIAIELPQNLNWSNMSLTNILKHCEIKHFENL